MLISHSLRTRILVLLAGSSILAGCKSSAPGTSFARFWPNRAKEESSDNDQALTEKWRNRIRPSAEDNPYSRLDGRANDDPRNPSRSRLANRTSRNRNGVRVPPQAETNWRHTTSPPVNRSNIFDVYRDSNSQSQPVDPFLQAELRDRTARQVSTQPPARRGTIAQTGRTGPSTTTTAPRSPYSAPRTPTTPTAAVDHNDLPAWARELAPRSAVAANSNDSLFGAANPRHQPTPPVAEADLPAWARGLSPQKTAPPDNAVPSRSVTTTNAQTAATNRPELRTSPITGRTGLAGRPSTKTGTLQASTVRRHPLSDDKPIIRPAVTHQTNDASPIENQAEHRRASVALDVSQLMKRSRIEARAGMMPEALKTAIAAEQLANSAGVRFSPNEQTPSQLVHWLRTEAEKQTSIVENEPQTPAAPVANPPVAKGSKPEHPSRVTIASGPNRWDSEFRTASAAMESSVNSDRTEARNASPSLWQSSAQRKTPPPKTAQRELPQWNPGTARSGSGATPTGLYPVTHHSLGRKDGTGARFASQTIYHPDNFRWVRLDESEATLRPDPVHDDSELNQEALPSDSAAAPPVPAKMKMHAATHSRSSKHATPEASDAAAGSPAAKTPLWRIALLVLSLLILLAAIVYRRRFMPLNV